MADQPYNRPPIPYPLAPAPLPQRGAKLVFDVSGAIGVLYGEFGDGDVNFGDPDNNSVFPLTTSWLQVDGATQDPLALGPLDVAGTGYSGEIAAGDTPEMLLAEFVVSGTVLQGETGDGAITLAEFAIAGTDSNVLTLPLLNVSGAGLSGAVGDAAFSLKEFGLSGVVYGSGEGGAAMALREFTIAGTAYNAPLIVGSILLPRFSLASKGFAGAIGTATLVLPLFEVDGAGWQAEVGTAAFTLPIFSVDGFVLSTVASPAIAALVVHAKTNAASTYSGVPYNSVALFNGVVLAASATGVYALTGTTDTGTPIAATLKGGAFDFGDERLKRLINAYVGYRTTGELELTITTDERDSYVYTLQPRAQSQVHPSRVKQAKGTKGRYFQWQVRNLAGADFDLDKLTFEADVLTRRIG